MSVAMMLHNDEDAGGDTRLLRDPPSETCWRRRIATGTMMALAATALVVAQSYKPASSMHLRSGAPKALLELSGFTACSQIRWGAHKELCVDVLAATKGNNPHLSLCADNGPFTKWRVPPTGSQGEWQLCEEPSLCLKAEGRALALASCDDKPVFQVDSKGAIALINNADDCFSDAGGKSYKPGDQIVLWPCKDQKAADGIFEVVLNCDQSAWSEWGACTVPCNGGTRTRSRTTLVDALNDGTACSGTVESQSCNTDSCDAVLKEAMVDPEGRNRDTSGRLHSEDVLVPVYRFEYDVYVEQCISTEAVSSKSWGPSFSKLSNVQLDKAKELCTSQPQCGCVVYNKPQQEATLYSYCDLSTSTSSIECDVFQKRNTIPPRYAIYKDRRLNLRSGLEELLATGVTFQTCQDLCAIREDCQCGMFRAGVAAGNASECRSLNRCDISDLSASLGDVVIVKGLAKLQEIVAGEPLSPSGTLAVVLVALLVVSTSFGAFKLGQFTQQHAQPEPENVQPEEKQTYQPIQEEQPVEIVVQEQPPTHITLQDRLAQLKQDLTDKATLVQELVSAGDTMETKAELREICTELTGLCDYVRPMCAAPWKEWRKAGNCQVCKAAVSQKESGLHCGQGGHRLCWLCTVENIDYNRLVVDRLSDSLTPEERASLHIVLSTTLTASHGTRSYTKDGGQSLALAE